MQPDPHDLPTSPSLSFPPVPSPQPPWPDQAGDQPPRRGLPPSHLAALAAGITVVTIIPLLLALRLLARGGTTPVLSGAAAAPTATASGAQNGATATPGSGGGGGGGATQPTPTTPRATPTMPGSSAPPS